MTTATPSGELVCSLLQCHAFRVASEAELQAAVERVLATSGWTVEREVRLSPRDRVDFLVGGVAVELKTRGRWPETLAQLQRYAAHARVSEVVLVTRRVQLAVHGAPLSVIGGKPFRVCRLVQGILA